MQWKNDLSGFKGVAGRESGGGRQVHSHWQVAATGRRIWSGGWRTWRTVFPASKGKKAVSCHGRRPLECGEGVTAVRVRSVLPGRARRQVSSESQAW